MKKRTNGYVTPHLMRRQANQRNLDVKKPTPSMPCVLLIFDGRHLRRFVV